MRRSPATKSLATLPPKDCTKSILATASQAQSSTEPALLLAQEFPPYTPPRRSQEIVITYGPVARSLSIAELTTLAETGVASQKLQSLLGFVNIPPETVRQFLNQPVRIEADFLDKNLNHVLGEFALFKLGEILQTGSGLSNIQALRSTLVHSARNDDQITALEFFQNYPLPQLYIDATQLVQLARLTRNSTAISNLVLNSAQKLEDFLMGVQTAIATEVCPCQTADSPSRRQTGIGDG